MALYVGTSGWAYREWKPAFYPNGIGQARFLGHYCSVFNACEINTTFYRVHDRTVVERWARATPETFRFTAKVHRRLTHARKISDSQRAAFLAGFAESLAPLSPRLTVLLWQFPATFERDDDALAGLLAAVPTGVHSSFEFRHGSWSDERVDRALWEAGVTRCLAEDEGGAPEALPPGPVAYVRLRADRYDDAARRSWLALLRAEARERDVYVFAKHRDAPADDAHTGLGLAGWLRASAL